MNFKFAAIGAIALTLTTCSTPALGSYPVPAHPMVSKITTVLPIKNIAEKTLIEKQIIKQNTLINNNKKMLNALGKLKKYVGKTWYVFSGATPSGWDCSGLTMWFYKQLGLDIEHRASRQQKYGVMTKTPKPGDIVAFTYKGYRSAYHVGIYIGNGKMIHAPKHGHLTKIDDINIFAGKHSMVSFRKLIETS
jgi:cell wall-associated NlpC family hydrolase